jgi:hypothetical protein
VPRIIPACVIAGDVIVGEFIASGLDAAAGSSALARPKSSTLLRDRERFVERDGALGNALRQIVALDQFHHQRGEIRCALQAVTS